MSRIEILTPDGVSGRTREEGAVTQPSGRLAPRLADLAGRQIALHDNAKPGSVELLAAIGTALTGPAPGRLPPP